jgi:hypothetical protein
MMRTRVPSGTPTFEPSRVRTLIDVCMHVHPWFEPILSSNDSIMWGARTHPSRNPARPEGRDDLVRAEAGAGGEGHRRKRLTSSPSARYRLLFESRTGRCRDCPPSGSTIRVLHLDPGSAPAGKFSSRYRAGEGSDHCCTGGGDCRSTRLAICRSRPGSRSSSLPGRMRQFRSQEPLVDRMRDVGDFTVPHPMASR